MIIRKTGGESTLRIIDGVLAALPDIRLLLPEGMKIKPVFNQAVFVKAALQSVLMGGLMAAALTGLMILLFLGNWRLTSIIMVSIPLCVLSAVIVMYVDGRIAQHDDARRLRPGRRHPGGQRHGGHREHRAPPEHGTPVGGRPSSGPRRKSAAPTMVSTLAICIVFVPIFLLQGTSKYLFSPLAVAVVASLLASLADLLHARADALQALDEELRASARHPRRRPSRRPRRRSPRRASEPLVPPHHGFNRYFLAFRDSYRNYLAWAVHHPVVCGLLFVGAAGVSCLLFPRIGMDFFP